jgi:hypothetical protein
MSYRIAIVMLLCLTGCGMVQPTVVTPAPQVTFAPVINSVVVMLSPDLSYIAPDPDARWTLVGTDLHAANQPTTLIRIDYTLKPEDDTPLANVLPTLTAETLEIQEVEGGFYAEGTTAVSNYVLYVDKGFYVMTFTLLDAVSDEVANDYIEDWRRIGLEGELIEMD